MSNQADEFPPLPDTPLPETSKHVCTCLYTRPGTYDARTCVAQDYMNKVRSIPDPFCNYPHRKGQ